MTKQALPLPESRHFHLEMVGEGLYAAIASDGGDAHSNAGIVDLGNQTLIFDTFLTPMAAEDLRIAAETLTGRPATYVVNSHGHSDHWYGNQVFAPSTPILATHKTRDKMLEDLDYISQYQAQPDHLRNQISALEAQAFAESNHKQKEALEAQIQMQRSLLAAIPMLTPRFANLTFEERIVIQGSQRSVELFSLGSGHTAGDTFMILPEDHIAFMGDLAFIQSHPFFADGDPQNWIDILQSLENFDLSVIIPGHGPLGNLGDLAMQEQYIMTVERLVTEVIRNHGTAEDAAREEIPAPFDQWKDVWAAAAFANNMRIMHERMTSE